MTSRPVLLALPLLFASCSEPQTVWLPLHPVVAPMRSPEDSGYMGYLQLGIRDDGVLMWRPAMETGVLEGQ